MSDQDSKPAESGQEASISATPVDRSTQGSLNPNPGSEQEPLEESIDGVRLIAVITSVTLVAFLMLLDMSIVSTVSGMPAQHWVAADIQRRFHKLQQNSALSRTSAGTGPPIILQGKNPTAAHPS